MCCCFKQRTAYEMRISDWSSDVCSSDLSPVVILWPTDPATPAALRSMAKAYGIGGVRFSGLPDANGTVSFLQDGALRSWEAANELGPAVVLMPMMSDQPHALPAAMKRIGEWARHNPTLHIVHQHFGIQVDEQKPN